MCIQLLFKSCVFITKKSNSELLYRFENYLCIFQMMNMQNGYTLNHTESHKIIQAFKHELLY